MDEECKFLAIKNWERYQFTLKNGKINSKWICDYTDQDSEPGIDKLTCLQRYMLQVCRRLRGRFGRNLDADLTWVLRAGNIPSTERARASDALRTLIERGFLILTNEELTFSIREDIKPKDRRGEDITPRRDDDKFQPTDECDKLIEQIVRSHPRNHRVGGVLIIPVHQSEACARAISRDGPELVEQGTLKYAQAVARWPVGERWKAYEPVRFWNESKYLEDPATWERNDGRISKKQSTTNSNREKIASELLGIDYRQNAGQGGNHNGPGVDERRKSYLAGTVKEAKAGSD